MSSPTAALRSPSNAVVGGLRSPANKDDQSQTSSIDPINKDDISKHANLIKSSLTTMFQPLYRKEHRMELIATSSSDNISKNGVQTYPFHYGEGYDLTPKPVTHRIEIDPNLFPTGKDTGNGSKQLITTYLEHVIDTKQPTRQQHVQLKRITNEFRDLTFDEQLEHVELRNIPYESSVAIQKALLPKHSSDAKKFFIMLTTALRENDATLVRLRLSNMAITDFIVQQLSKGICRNTFLQYLILNNNAITDHGIESLCSALRWHPTCHSIWLGGNKVTDIGLRHLALLCHRNPVITELNLANKWPTHASAKELELHPFITSVGVEYLCNQLKKEYSQLTSLSLANQRIRDTGASKLFEILPLTTLRTLNLTNNELSSTCCVALQESLRQNPILEELIVSKNQLDDVGVIEIATGLAFNSNLSTLDISYNQVHMKGLYALYQCLQYNTTLTSLITVGNEAKDERAENLVANRSRSIFVFPSMSMSPANSSGGPSPSFAAGSSPFHGRAKSIVPNSMKELRASLSMNPEEEMKKSDVEHEQNRRSSPQHSPTRKTRRSYGSFAEFAQSPFRSSIRQNSFKAGASSDEEGNDGPVGLVADANTLANSNGIETLGRKKRDKSIMSGMDLLYDDELSIKEGEVEVEEADDDDSVQQRVREKLQTASKKTRGGPINIQDAIATAVSIVEELEREEADRPHTGETKRKRHMKDSGVSLTVDVSSPSNFKRKGGAAGKATTPGQSLIKQSSGLQRMNSNNSLNSDKATNSPSLAKTTATVPSSSSAKAILQQDVKKTSKSKKKKKVRLQTTATVGGDEDTDGTHSGADSDADSLGSNSIAGGDDADDNASINSVNSNGTHRSEKGGKSLNELMKERRARKQNNGGFTPKVGLANKPVPINPFELSSEERQKYFDKHVPVFAQETKAIATLKNRRLSQDYGKTLGVPHIKSMGIRPIRTSISAYADSGQHLMYLRVATEDDPDDTRPYSIIKIGLDKRDERDRIRQSRQTEAYKLAKMELMTQKAKEKPQQAAVSRVPEKFWRNWRMKVSYFISELVAWVCVLMLF